MKYLLPLVLIATPVFADNLPRCADAQEMHDVLVKDYGEKPFLEMKNSQGGQLVMYLNPETSTWTVIETDWKKSCGISAGTEFKPSTEKHFKDPVKDKKPEIPM